ncbi:hypothetical protein ACIPQ1_04540 [Pseudomonas sp. LARHCG127]|uniref:hypothetical protein n=1 Tax=unclassified Pseudomonas TaxID=196821 RepID=UPI003984AFE5
MGNVLKTNSLILILVSLCLVLSAGCQLLIPYIISQGVIKITDTVYVVESLRKLATVFIARTILQGIADSLNAYAETSLRVSLIEYIYIHRSFTAHGAFITRITEDTARIATAISSALYLFGSGLLVVTTSCLLIVETPYFLIPLLFIWLLTALQLKKSSPIITKLYQAEILKEEKYKASFLTLIKSANIARHRCNYRKHYQRLNKAAGARHKHQKISLLLCSMPEVLIAIATVFIVIFIASTTPELLGSKYIYLLGYVGLFAMASRQSLETALSLVGINESVKRIFEGTQHE